MPSPGGRAPCEVYQVAYLQNQPSEDVRRTVARVQRVPRGRQVRLDRQRVLPARHDALATRYTQHLRPLRRAAAAATAPRRGASSSARASRPRAASPSHNSTKVERKKGSKGAAKTREKGRRFSRKNHLHPQSSFQARRAGREVPWPSRRSCRSFRSFAFYSFGEQFADACIDPADIYGRSGAV